MKEIEGTGGQYLLVFDRGEKLMAGLTEFAKKVDLQGGVISGIGALTNAELGAYDLDKKEYHKEVFSAENYELISMMGNFSLKDGEPFAHVHVGLGGHDFKQFGGHLFEADVAVTAEVYIHPLGIMPERKYSESIGLGLICGVCG